ncbi:MAG: hypothetical protein WAS73_05025 [Defluviicoccus sp.]
MLDATLSRRPDTGADASAITCDRLTRHLAYILFRHTQDLTVRTLEGIAAALCNRADGRVPAAGSAPAPADRPAFPDWLVLLQSVLNEEMPEPPVAADFTEPRRALCLRTAVRAVSRALKDPTGGATDFHPSGALPPWAWPRTPCACIGTFVFYRRGE